MKIKMFLMAVVLIGQHFSLSALAQMSCPDPVTTDPIKVVVDIGLTNLNYTKYIPKFDSTLGELISVNLTSQAGGVARIDVDSEDPEDQMWRLIARGGVIITLPNGHEEIAEFGTPVDGDLVETAPDDEPGMWDADFAGPDFDYKEYGTLDDPYWADEVMFNYTVEDDEFDQFNGSHGEVLEIYIRTFGNSAAIGETSASKQERSYAYAGGWVEVEYTYCPPKYCINGSKLDACTGEGLSGWEIILFNSTGVELDRMTTGADGTYSFCGLLPGSYSVEETLKPGWFAVESPVNPIDLGCASSENNNFKNQELLCINGSTLDACSG